MPCKNEPVFIAEDTDVGEDAEAAGLALAAHCCVHSLHLKLQQAPNTHTHTHMHTNAFSFSPISFSPVQQAHLDTVCDYLMTLVPSFSCSPSVRFCSLPSNQTCSSAARAHTHTHTQRFSPSDHSYCITATTT